MRQTQREIAYDVRRGRLMRNVRFPDGRSYTHHCTLEVLQEVAWVVEERGQAGVTTHELWEALPNSPCTQIALALAFLKDRGIVETERRRSYPASTTLFEDAMIEYYVLAEGPEGEAPDGK